MGERIGTEPRRDSAPDPSGDPERIAHTICLDLLARAPRTRAQLTEALHKRGLPPDAVARVLDRLDEVRLIDDSAYARAWVTSRRAGRGLARRALEQELRQRGIEPELAAEAAAEIDPASERRAAEALAERRIRQVVDKPADVAVRRLVGMMERKGYSAGLSYAVARAAWERHRPEAAPDDGPLPDP
jgi:regulatory protein